MGPSVRVNQDDIRFWAPIIVLCAAMLSASLLIAINGGQRPFFNIVIYAAGELAAVFIAILCFAFFRVFQLARVLADEPLRSVWAELRPKLSLFLVPLVAFPLFLAGFTAAKSSIGMMVGYHFDGFFALADASIFGTDPWRITHALLRERETKIIDFVYGPVWTAVFGLSIAFVPAFCKKQTAGRFFITIFMTWFVGGFLAAYALSSAGPVFAYLVDPAVGARFAPLRADLARLFPPDSVLAASSTYLEQGFRSGKVITAGGISAMPSMHIATVTIYILLTKGTRLFWPAVGLAALILVGSVHTGYHYFVDAPVAAAIALLCWKTAGALLLSENRAVERILVQSEAVEPLN